MSRLRDRLLVPVTVLMISLYRAKHGDVSEAIWMAREGQDLLDGSPLIHPDRWSWDPQPWDFIPTSPAWQYISAGAWLGFGDLGPHLLAFTVTAVCLGAIAWICKALGANPTSTVIALGFVLLISGGILNARAGLPAFALLLVAVHVVSRQLECRKQHEFFGILVFIALIDVIVCYIGIWLHQSWATFAPALAVLQVFAAWQLGYSRTRLIGIASLGAVATSIGVVAGPIGWRVWPESLRVAEVCRGLVKEWTAVWQNGPVWIALWVLCLAALGIVVGQLIRKREHRDVVALAYTGIAAAAIIAGGPSLRFLLLGAYALAPVLAMVLSRTAFPDRAANLRSRLGERVTEPYWRNVTALLVIPLLVITLLDVRSTSISPDPAYASLPAGCNVFAKDRTSKFVALYRPDVKIWVDGRQHYWGRERLQRAGSFLRGDAGLVPLGTTCVMLEVGESVGLRALLNVNPSWQRLTTTDAFEVWALR